jgi:integrating conjugative element protein (TIGR03746 family)
MSRFKNEIEHLSCHVSSLRRVIVALFAVTLLLAFGWWSAPRALTIHIPPDLRSGSIRKWWEVPPENVYLFALYIWQQLQHWPTDGEHDYPKNLQALSAYLTPACQSFLRSDFEARRNTGELRRRMRGIQEITGRGYSDDPALRVKTLSARDWVVTLDMSADEYFEAEHIKRALVRYRLKVARNDVDPEHNPFGLVLDCHASSPQRIEAAPSPGAPTNPKE